MLTFNAVWRDQASIIPVAAVRHGPQSKPTALASERALSALVPRGRGAHRATMPIMDPCATTSPQWWARAMPPLWRYFSRLQKPDAAIAAPKDTNHAPARHFTCIPGFSEPLAGTVIAFMDPWRADAAS
jgi:hypothetical protein